MPGAVADAAHRVVQESLTNALRYAAGARGQGARPRRRRDARARSGQRSRARGRPRSPGTGTGNGLRGLRERVQACGGRLDAGPLPEGGWRVAARLPQRAAAAVPEAAAAAGV